MTIAEKLQTIAENEPKVYEAGREKGYREGYTDATSGTAFEIDESTAYRKVVPSASEKLAQVLKLGGMSYKSKNLLPYPYKETTKTSNGVTWTDNGDGSITATGTVTAYTYISLATIEALPNTTYVFSGMANTENMIMEIDLLDDSDATIQALGLTNQIASGRMMVKTADYPTVKKFKVLLKRYYEGKAISGTAYPMCNYGETVLPYEPYFEGIRDAKVTELVSEGANLLPYPYTYSNHIVEGITFTDNGDGTVTANGTPRYSANFFFHDNNPSFNKLPKGTYYLSGCPSGYGTNVYITLSFHDENGKWLAEITDYGSGKVKNLTDINYSIIRAKILITAGTVCDNLVFKPMLVHGSTPQEYKPYIGTIATKPIPEALRNFLEDKGYGLGIDSTYFNYIDYERKVFVQNVIKVSFDGTENCYFDGDFDRGELPLPFRAKDGAKAICNKSEQNPNALYGAEQGFVVHDDYLLLTIGWYEDTDAFKAQLATWYAEGNPLTVIYALAEPVETDISEYLTGDNLIEVQGGGTITAVNEYEYAVPSTIQFIKKVGA